MMLRFLDFRVRERPVEIRLHELLALVAPVDHSADSVEPTSIIRPTPSSLRRSTDCTPSRGHPVCEILLQDTPTAVQARHHGADRDVEDLGRVRVRELA